MKLHLGCGFDKKEGYLNCDISPEVNPDKIVDLEKSLPFEDNSVSEIYTRHTLEHIENLIPLMKEFRRTCIKGAKIRIVVPYFSHAGASQDPSHKRFFTWKTFDYFEKDNKLCFYGLGLFKIKKKELRILISRPFVGKPLARLFNKFPNFYERFFVYLIPATEIKFVLEVLK